MPNSEWSISVSDLRGTTTFARSTIGGDNWIAAFKRFRGELGEPQEVPPGASCTVAQDGKVIIHDPLGNRTYRLEPIEPVSNEAPSPIPLSSPPVSALPPVARSISGYVPPAPSTVDAKKREARSPKQTVAYVDIKSMMAPQVQRPVSALSPPLVPPPQPLIAYAEPVLEAEPPPIPELTVPATHSQHDASLIQARDENPTADNPLCYRERSYFVSPDINEEHGEALLRTKFDELRSELAGLPQGKFLNLALFDHVWNERPKGPPLVTLRWKDWKGEPEIAFPARIRRSSIPTMGDPGPLLSSMPPHVAAPPAISLKPEQALAPTQPAPPEPFQVQQMPSIPRAPVPQKPAPRIRREPTDEHDVRLAHAFEACQDLLFLSSTPDAVSFALKLLSELLPSEAMSALLYDINHDEFRVVLAYGPDAELRHGQAVPPKIGLLGAASQLTTPLRVSDPHQDQRYEPHVDAWTGLEVRTILYMPLSHRGRLFGILQLINSRRDPTFTASDGDLVAYVGQQLATFLYQVKTSTT